MRLPLFPLHAVVFPHLPLPIHVFEERYRAMVRDVLADGSPFRGRFAVSMITEGGEVGDTPARPTTTRGVGTIVEIRSADRFDDGRWAILAVGEARVALGALHHGTEYVSVETELLPEVVGDLDAATRLLPSVQAALDAYLSTVKQFVTSAASIGSGSQEVTRVAASLDEVLKPIVLPDDPLAASYAVAGVLQIELIRKQSLLEQPDAASRLRAELELLRRESSLLADGAMPPVGSGDLGYHAN